MLSNIFNKTSDNSFKPCDSAIYETTMQYCRWEVPKRAKCIQFSVTKTKKPESVKFGDAMIGKGDFLHEDRDKLIGIIKLREPGFVQCLWW